MRIVIIGGTGLIGAKLVSLLHSRGHDVIPASPDHKVRQFFTNQPRRRKHALKGLTKETFLISGGYVRL